MPADYNHFLIRSLQDGSIRTVVERETGRAMRRFVAEYGSKVQSGDRFEVKPRLQGDWETFVVTRRGVRRVHGE